MNAFFPYLLQDKGKTTIFPLLQAVIPLGLILQLLQLLLCAFPARQQNPIRSSCIIR